MSNEIQGYALYRKSAQITNGLTINNVYMSNDKQLCTLIVNKPIDGVVYNEDDDSYSIGKTRRVVMYTSTIINRLIDNPTLAPIATYLAKNRDILATLLVGATVDIASLRIEANATNYITPEGETAEWGKDHATIIHAIDGVAIDLANDTVADNYILATYTAAGIPKLGEDEVAARVASRLKKQLTSVLKSTVATAITANTAISEKADGDTATK